MRAVVECCLEGNLPITSKPVGPHQAKSLGVTRLVVVVEKTSCYTVEWSARDDPAHTDM